MRFRPIAILFYIYRMQPITFSTRLDKKSFIALSLTTMINSRFAKVYYSIALLSIFLFVVYYGFANEFINSLVAGLVVLMLFFPFRVLLLSSSRYKNAPSAGEPIFWTINDDGIEWKGKNSSSKLSWAGVLKITESKKWVYMWYSKTKFVFFNREMLTAEQLHETKSVWQAHKRKMHQ